MYLWISKKYIYNSGLCQLFKIVNLTFFNLPKGYLMGPLFPRTYFENRCSGWKCFQGAQGMSLQDVLLAVSGDARDTQDQILREG